MRFIRSLPVAGYGRGGSIFQVAGIRHKSDKFAKFDMSDTECLYKATPSTRYSGESFQPWLDNAALRFDICLFSKPSHADISVSLYKG